MDGDQFSVLDVVLVLMLSFFLWLFDLLSRSSSSRKTKKECLVYPMGGRRFYWRLQEKEKNESFNH